MSIREKVSLWYTKRYYPVPMTASGEYGTVTSVSMGTGTYCMKELAGGARATLASITATRSSYGQGSVWHTCEVPYGVSEVYIAGVLIESFSGSAGGADCAGELEKGEEIKAVIYNSDTFSRYVYARGRVTLVEFGSSPKMIAKHSDYGNPLGNKEWEGLETMKDEWGIRPAIYDELVRIIAGLGESAYFRFEYDKERKKAKMIVVASDRVYSEIDKFLKSGE